MLNVGDSLLILPSLLLLILSVGGLDGLVSMGRCKWVEDPHVKECAYILSFPQNPRAFASSLGVGKFLNTIIIIAIVSQLPLALNH